jgi:hypothetical protein
MNYIIKLKYYVRKKGKKVQRRGIYCILIAKLLSI